MNVVRQNYPATNASRPTARPSRVSRGSGRRTVQPTTGIDDHGSSRGCIANHHGERHEIGGPQCQASVISWQPRPTDTSRNVGVPPGFLNRGLEFRLISRATLVLRTLTIQQNTGSTSAQLEVKALLVILLLVRGAPPRRHDASPPKR